VLDAKFAVRGHRSAGIGFHAAMCSRGRMGPRSSKSTDATSSTG
jgi:hypothetical protein